MAMNWRHILREPLVHFLIAGAILFSLSALFGQSWGIGYSEDRIHVSAEKIRQLRETWTKRWGAEPNAEQLRSLIDDFIREEVLYREAIASGLDKDDTVVRRRLAQKVEFLAQSLASIIDPSESELEQYFEQHTEQYVIPAQVGFSHVYFSRSSRGSGAERAARDARAKLTSGQTSVTEASQLGDRFMLQYEYPPQTRAQIRDLFGASFAARVFDLAPDRWEGPVPSSYGVHVVRVRHRVPSRTPDLDEVRSQVTRDFEDARLRTAADTYYQGLRQRFEIDIAEAALERRGP